MIDIKRLELSLLCAFGIIVIIFVVIFIVIGLGILFSEFNDSEQLIILIYFTIVSFLTYFIYKGG